MKPAKDALSAYFKELGSKGGKAAADSMTDEDKRARASKAAKAKWKKAKRQKVSK